MVNWRWRFATVYTSLRTKKACLFSCCGQGEVLREFSGPPGSSFESEVKFALLRFAHTQTHTFSRERTGESESSTSASRLKLKRLHGIESNSTVVYARKLFIKIVLQHIQRSISSCNASPRAGAHTNDVYELESRHTHAYTSRDIPHGLLQTSAYTVVRISL